jgi:hypothetical protein
VEDLPSIKSAVSVEILSCEVSGSEQARQRKMAMVIQLSAKRDRSFRAAVSGSSRASFDHVFELRFSSNLFATCNLYGTRKICQESFRAAQTENSPTAHGRAGLSVALTSIVRINRPSDGKYENNIFAVRLKERSRYFLVSFTLYSWP